MPHFEFIPKRPLCLILMFAAACLTGCGNEAQEKVAMRRACLSTLGVAYHQYFEEHQIGPPSVEEFASFIEKNADGDKTKVEAVKRLRELDIVVFWNASLEADGDANDKYLLAFEAPCPGSGGYVVMGGGFVDHVNAKEFGELKEIPRKEPSVQTDSASTVAP